MTDWESKIIQELCDDICKHYRCDKEEKCLKTFEIVNLLKREIKEAVSMTVCGILRQREDGGYVFGNNKREILKKRGIE